MTTLYNRIEALCGRKSITITQMCKDAGVSRASLTDLKMNRKQSLSSTTLSKIASYFGVSVDYLLGHNETKKQLAINGELHLPENLSDDKLRAIQFILSHNDDEIKRFMAVGDVMFDKG